MAFDRDQFANYVDIFLQNRLNAVWSGKKAIFFFKSWLIKLYNYKNVFLIICLSLNISTFKHKNDKGIVSTVQNSFMISLDLRQEGLADSILQ